MTVKPINQRYLAVVKLDATGSGSVQITPRADFVLQQTRWTVQGGTGTSQSTATNSINGDEFEGTYSGNNDQSRASRLITNADIVQCDWVGGPPLGTATLYMFGVEYPAGQGIPPPASGNGPGNPILGGDTLIRNAVQSEDFAAGISGWAIFKDGSYEFGPGGTFRGNVTVTGPDGSQVSVENDGSHASIDLTPPTYTDPSVVNLPATIEAGSNGATANTSFGTLDLRSPQPGKLPATFSDQALLSLQSSTVDKTVGTTAILQALSILLGTSAAGLVKVAGKLIDRNQNLYLRGEAGIVSVSFTTLSSFTVAVGFGATFDTTPVVTTNINNGAGATAQWHSRAINVSNTGFTLFVFATATSTWANIPVEWQAVETA